MLATATIVFREFIEIALVLSIIMAATRGIKGRSTMVATGLILGFLGSAIIAFFTDTISQAIDGVGQEVFNAAIMFTAVALLGWTVVWMKKHGRELSQNLKKVGADVLEGNLPTYTIITIIALATFREGAEIVLFVYGMIASGKVTISSILLGGTLGATGGVTIGLMFYLGLLKAQQKHFFTITGWLLILLTAGMAAQGAAFLISADILPAITPTLWDTSSIISGRGFIGQTLGALIGYTPRPSGMEVLIYVSVVLLVGGLYHTVGNKQKGN